MAWLAGVEGALLDVDGTLIDGDQAVPGAAEALERLRRAGIPFRLTTNTTRRPRREVAAVLLRAGLRTSEREIIAPSILARRRILESGRPRAALLVPPACRIDFEGIVEDQERPDWVVVGDLGNEFTWERLNRAFSWIRAGAELLALHKNRSWHAGRELGLVLDAGPFVAALEYASGKVAQVVGKPSPEFFRLALEELGVPPSRVLVVGDDPENDCGGGQRVGCRGAVVRTGKFDAAALVRQAIAPDLILDSVAALDPDAVNP
jgi:HAD superfamily hydrolase (TIGR01458 family)